jgi:hypothetical protein
MREDDGKKLVRIFLKDGSVLELPMGTVLMSLINDESKDSHVRINEIWANGDGGEFFFRRVKKGETGERRDEDADIVVLFHKLWTAAVGMTGYNKSQWKDLANLLWFKKGIRI